MAHNIKASNLKGLIIKTFESLRPHIKNWTGFIAAIQKNMENIILDEIEINEFRTKSKNEITLLGDQIGGGRDTPPEYQEYYVQVPSDILIKSTVFLKYLDIIKLWTTLTRPYLLDVYGFKKEFLHKFLDDEFTKSFAVMFSALARKKIDDLFGTNKDFWIDVGDIEEWIEEDLSDTSIETGTLKQVGADKCKIKTTMSGQGLKIWIDIGIELEMELEYGDDRSVRASKQAAKWNSLPKGWTQKSVEKFWSSLTGDRKHKVTACIKKMDGKVDNPGAFCASLNDKIDPGWRSRKKTATRLAARWMMKHASDKTAGVTKQQQKKAVKRLAPIIIQDLNRVYDKNDPYASDMKSLICGFIYLIFEKQRPHKTQLTTQIGRLFEQGGPSLAYGNTMQVYGIAKSYMTHIHNLGGWVAAASLAVELLMKGKMRTLSARVDGILSKELGDELAVAVNNPTKKMETPTQILKRLVQVEMPSARGLTQAVGKDPNTIRAYISAIFEDINWHNVSGQLAPVESIDIDYNIVSDISKGYSWSLEPSAMFGIAALSLVNDRSGISIIKKAIKNDFPDLFKNNAEVI